MGTKKNNRVGIFGCTADPFTLAHLNIIQTVLSKQYVDELVVIPSESTWYRNNIEHMFDIDQRVNIISRFICTFDVPNVYVLHPDRLQFVTDNGFVPTIYERGFARQLELFMYAMNIDRKDCINSYSLILGEDSFYTFNTWVHHNYIKQNVNFIVARRGGVDHDKCLFEKLSKDLNPKVIEIDDEYSNLSATAIRNRLISDDMQFLCRTPYELYMEAISSRQMDILNPTSKNKNTDNIVEKLVTKNIQTEGNNNMDSNMNKTVLCHTPIFDVVHDIEVKPGFKPVKIDSPDWVTVIVKRDNKFLMETQLRYGVNKECEEFPCGMVENGEEPIQAAYRELMEETGICLTNGTFDLRYLGRFSPNPAFMTNYMYYYFVDLNTAAYSEVGKKLDEHEDIKIFWKDIDDAFKSYMFSDGSAIMAGAWLHLMRVNVM